MYSFWGSLSDSRKESFQRLQDKSISLYRCVEDKRRRPIISCMLSNLSRLIVPLWPKISSIDQAQNGFGVNSNKDPNIVQLQHAILHEEILKFPGILWSMPKRFSYSTLKVGVIRVCGTAEFEENLLRNTEF